MKETQTYKNLKDLPRTNNPEYIVVHHTGGTKISPNTDTSHHTANGVEVTHLQFGWEGIGYHYFIEKNGEVWKGRPEHRHGAHVKEGGINSKSLGICLAGNFTVEGRKPTVEQENALAGLIGDIRGRYPIPIEKVQPHRTFLGDPPYKDCYGDQLPDDWAQKLKTSAMTPDQEKHLQRIKDKFLAEVDKKYRNGQREHGGNLWLKPGMLDMALEEVIDLAVYLYTLKEQQK